MTSEAPRHDSMRPVAAAPELNVAGRRIVRGHFADPQLEAEFRRETLPETARTVRAVALLAGFLVMLFCAVDYMALGLGWKLYAAWGLRVAFLGSALAVAVVSRQRRSFARLDTAAFGMMMMLSVAIFLWVYLERKGLMRETPSTLLAILGFYLFLSIPLALQCFASAVLTVSFMAAQIHWGPHTTGELATVGVEMIIVNVLGAFTAMRNHTQQRREYLKLRQLRRRAGFEELVAGVSSQFINLRAEHMDTAIHHALGQVAEFAGADRCFVFEFDAMRSEVSCTYEWCGEGIDPGPIALQRVPNAAFGWGMEQMQQRRLIVARRLSDLPPEAVAERAALQRFGVRSLLSVPLVCDERVIGSVSLHAVRAETLWSGDAEALLRLVGEMMVNVIMRMRSDEELRRERRTLEASVEALERSNAELQQFAYVASHDLQEPLRAVSSFSRLLAERYGGKLDARADEYIRYLREAAGRMHALIGDLLAYSRLETQARPFSRCDTGAIVQDAIANLRASIDALRARVECEALPPIEGDPAQLMQLFQNLIGNAIKFNASHPPRVWVRARRSGAAWTFSVADNGIGIEARYHERLFKLFSRLHPTDQYPGTGIGLATCKRIVERHRGRIWVERRAPHGSIFYFTLPAAGEEAAPAHTRAA